MTNAITRHGEGSDLDAMLRTASALRSAGGMIPQHLRSEGEILAVIMAGRELGLGPMASLRSLFIVKGKVGLSYDAMVGLLRQAGYRVEWKETTNTRAVLVLTHPDGSTHTETWDVERAKKAELWGSSMWKKYPDTMLRARCVSSAARAFAGDVLAGCYSVDEVREISGGRVTGHDDGGDITVTVHDSRGANEDHGYHNPEAVEEREAAKAAARAWADKHLPALEECVTQAAAEMQEAADREADAAELEAIKRGHENAMREWADEHVEGLRAVAYAHPIANKLMGLVHTRLRNWSREVGLGDAFAQSLLDAKQEAAQ